MSDPERYDDLAELIRGAGARPSLPSDRAQRILASVAPVWRRQVRAAGRRRAVVLIALAATIAVGAGLGIASWRGAATVVFIAETTRVSGADPLLASPGAAARSLTAGLAVEAGDTLTTGQGRAALRLRTGASLRVDRESAIRFVSPSVVALERGALYLDSDSPPGAPGAVEVRTPFGVVHEVGTRFEVRMVEDRLRVRVREGAVLVTGESSRFEAQARDELSLGADGRLRRGVVPPYGPAWDWVLEIAPGVALDGGSLEAFLLWVGRETGWTVVLGDAETARIVSTIRVHAPFSDVTPVEALPIVLSACDLSHRLEDGVLTIGPAARRTMGAS